MEVFDLWSYVWLREREMINKSVPHLNRQNMVMAIVREMRESVYPAVYMVFT